MKKSIMAVILIMSVPHFSMAMEDEGQEELASVESGAEGDVEQRRVVGSTKKEPDSSRKRCRARLQEWNAKGCHPVAVGCTALFCAGTVVALYLLIE